MVETALASFISALAAGAVSIAPLELCPTISSRLTVEAPVFIQ